MTKSRTCTAILLLLVLLGGALRLYGIKHNLPFRSDPDEPVMISYALKMLKTRDFNPHFFGPPATTVMYALVAVYGGMYAGGRVLGIYHGPEDFRLHYRTDRTAFFFAARMVSWVFGVALIPLVFFLTRRLSGDVPAILAATLMAVSPGSIYLSKLVRMDMPMTFLLLLALWFCLNICEKADKRSYILAGFFTGLAVVTKFTAAYFVLVIIIAHFAAQGLRLAKFQNLVLSGVACLTGAFLGSPFVFLDFKQVLADVGNEARAEHLGATGSGFLPNLFWYFRDPLREDLTILGVLFLILGLVSCAASKDRRRWVAAAAFACLLFFISSLNLRWARWAVPMVPFAAVLIALSLEKLKSRPAWVAVVVVAMAAPLAATAFVAGRELHSDSTQIMARDWILKNVPQGSHVAVEQYTPELPDGRYQLFVSELPGQFLPLKVEDSVPGAPVYPEGRIGNLREVRQLCGEHIDYVLLSDFADRYASEKEHYRDSVAIYESLLSRSPVVYEVKHAPGENAGPRIRVLKLGRELCETNIPLQATSVQ